jgi:hypothetical protein
MNQRQKKYRERTNKQGMYTHGALYLMVRDLVSIVKHGREEHPRTTVWRDLEEIANEMDLAQKDWFSESQGSK